MAEVFDSRHARAAETSIGAQLDATRNAASAREAAQADIVRTFGNFIRGGGPGPTEEQLRQFAKLAADEERRRRRLADRLAARPADNEPKPSVPVVPRPLRAVALLAMWAVAIPIVVVAAFGPREGAFSPAREKMAMPAAPAAPAVALAQAPQASPEPPVVAAQQSRAAPPTKTTRSASSSRGRVTASPLQARAGARGPVAKCTPLSFVIRAVCMNYACAQPSVRRSLQCVEPLRQRRIDEARRNPLLLG